MWVANRAMRFGKRQFLETESYEIGLGCGWGKTQEALESSGQGRIRTLEVITFRDLVRSCENDKTPALGLMEGCN